MINGFLNLIKLIIILNCDRHRKYNQKKIMKFKINYKLKFKFNLNIINN